MDAHRVLLPYTRARKKDVMCTIPLFFPSIAFWDRIKAVVTPSMCSVVA